MKGIRRQQMELKDNLTDSSDDEDGQYITLLFSYEGGMVSNFTGRSTA
jgi:hypothetical protein